MDELPPAGRLVVRRWHPDDVPGLHVAVIESIDHLRPWMPWVAKEPLLLAERIEMVDGWAPLWDAGDRMCGMFAGDQVVGGCGLHERIGPGGLAIGYWVRVGCTGRGYATAAAGQLTSMAFEMPGVAHVEIHHDVANPASGRIPAKLGFAHLRDEPHPPEAPGESGTQRIWRMERAAWLGRTASGGGPPSATSQHRE